MLVAAQMWLKSYRIAEGGAPISTEFYICDTDGQNFIFGIIVSARLNLDFELARDDCANTLRRAKFRLSRRINLRFLGRLNLKCALLWRKFKARFGDQI